MNRQALPRLGDDAALVCVVVTGMLNKHVANALGAAEKTVFITAHDDAGTCERAQKAPTTEYLSKPFEDQSLLGAIHQAIRGASGRGEDAP